MYSIVLLFSFLACVFAAYPDHEDGFTNVTSQERAMSRAYWDTAVTDINGRPLNFGEGFWYSIQNYGSRLYQMVSKSGQSLLVPELDKYNKAYFADFWLINNTENNFYYTYWYICGDGWCWGTGPGYVSQLGAQFTRGKSMHPFYDNYWLQGAKYNSIGKYLADLGNNRWGYCADCTGAEPRTKWIIKLHPDIKLYGRLYDFSFVLPSKDILESAVSKEAYESQVIVNNGNVVLARQIERKFYLSGYKQLSFTGSLQDSFSLFDTLSTNIQLTLSVQNKTINSQSKIHYSKSNKDTNQKSFQVPNPFYYEEKVTEQIVVYPGSKVRVDSYVNWIDELAIPFKAKLRVTGDDIHDLVQDPKGDGNLKKQQMYQAKIQRLLDIYRIKERLISSTSYSQTYEVNGVFKGSFAINAQVELVDI